MCHYKHLTLIEREKILLFYDEGKSVTAIAELLGRSKSTISRELRRNASDDEYIPAIAENNYRERRKKCCRHSGKAEGKTADAVNKAMEKLLWGKPLRSVTPDRGKEFAKHAELSEQLDEVQFYFPKPHQPWQRGTNENTNGLLREYFPKGKDITDIPEEYIAKVVAEVNFRPRKVLGYKTPYEIFYDKSLHLT